MTNRIQILRSSVAGNVPAPATRSPGEMWTNFPDLQLGVIDASRNAQKLLAVRWFSTLASYVAGDLTVQGGAIYVANGAVAAGAFTPAQWTKLATLGDLTTGYLPLAGGTLTGPLTLAADPSANLGAATKQYVDSKTSAIYLPLTGGTLTGPLVLNSALTANPANSNVSLSPTGTGTVTLNPATPGHIDNCIIGGTTPAAATVTSLNGGQLAGMRNLAINGDFRIDQRNNGVAIVPTALGYCLDRWLFAISQPSKLSVQRNTTSAPGSFYCVYSAVQASYTPAAADYFAIQQPIEGLNAAQLHWGTANAQPITISARIWASGASGNLAVAVRNSPITRSYVALVPVTTTPTVVSFTVPGDTAGTWAADNTQGLSVSFDLGSGTTANAPAAGAWQAGNYTRATGQTCNLVSAANGSNLSITDVQVEMGTVATPFERRLIGTELNLCQRYYQRYTGPASAIQLQGYNAAGQTIAYTMTYPAMRASPTGSMIGTWAVSNCGSPTLYTGLPNAAVFYIVITALGSGYALSPANGGFDLSAEL